MKNPRRGFTLVEVLIATILMAALMAGLWVLLDIYSQLFETGPARTEQSQLARALMQVISEDLRSAIQEVQVETGGKPNGGSATVETGSSATRRFGLFGSEKELSIDIVQLTPNQVFDARTQEEEETRFGEEEVPSAPELRTVHYRFVEPETEEDELEAEYIDVVVEEATPKDPPGLTRREYTFDPIDPEEEEQKALTAATVADPDAGTEEDSGDMLNVAQEETAEALTDDFTVTYAPEVLDIRFRYFDGGGWASSWDSIAKKSLPVAVEVTLKLKSFDPRDDRPVRLGEIQAGEGEFDLGGGNTADGIDQEESFTGTSLGGTLAEDVPAKPDRTRTYRLLVDLPTAARHPGAKPVSTSAMDRIRPSAPAPRPLVAPRLAVPPPSRPERSETPAPALRRGDQWMRTNSPGER